MSGPILEVCNLCKSFGGVQALRDVTLSLYPGEVQALCGENGAGKSTLIKCLSGVWPHGSYTGRILMDGGEVCFRHVSDSEACGIAVIHQELALVREMTVAENIFLGNEPRRGGLVDWNRVYRETASLLARYRILLDPVARVGDLGIGEQQLVEIAKALSRQARILLLDEPSAALTDTEVGTLLEIVADLRARGMACVYISHKLDEVLRIADRITVFRDGRTIVTRMREETTRADLIRHMVGREIVDLFPRVRSSPGEVLLKVEGLGVRNTGGSCPELDDISFQVRAGEVLGIGGLMGSGRTELLLHLFAGTGTRCSGLVELAGRAHDSPSPAASINAGLMLVSEDRKRNGLIPEQSVGFNLSLSSLSRFCSRCGLLDRHAEIGRNQILFDTLQIRAPGQETPVSSLSGGNQQKVVVGKALMTEPRVIFLDEPTRGIDVGAKQEIYELVNRLTAEGKAVILVSSELPELMGMSDRMLILSNGRIGGRFEGSAVTQEEILRAAMAYN